MQGDKVVSPRSVARITYPSPAVPVSQSFLSSPETGRARTRLRDERKGAGARIRRTGKETSTKRVHGDFRLEGAGNRVEGNGRYRFVRRWSAGLSASEVRDRKVVRGCRREVETPDTRGEKNDEDRVEGAGAQLRVQDRDRCGREEKVRRKGTDVRSDSRAKYQPYQKGSGREKERASAVASCLRLGMC